jgi:hypothetical protein
MVGSSGRRPDGLCDENVPRMATQWRWRFSEEELATGEESDWLRVAKGWLGWKYGWRHGGRAAQHDGR